MGAEVREKLASCSATKLAGTRMAWLPGARIAGTFPAVILRRTLWPLRFQRLATCATVR